MTKPKDYRIRIIKNDCRTYIVRRGKRVDYISSGETPLALSNLLSNDAAEMRFMLEDASDGDRAATALRKYFAAMAHCPKVEVL